MTPRHRTRLLDVLAAAVLLCAVLWAGSRLAAAPQPRVELASYATSLVGRSAGQRHNAALAARALNGAVLPPGGVFSFNRAVRSWSFDQGYVKAPVSFDGELVRAFGGGVCQTSTTLYNAALNAGLEVVERHRHSHVPRYIAPGRDAAVAFPTVDLRLRNPWPEAVRLEARVEGDRLVVAVWGRRRSGLTVTVVTRVLDVEEPHRVVRPARPVVRTRAHVSARAPGLPGYRVVTWRVFSSKGRVVRRERLTDDAYPPLHRVVQTSDGGGDEQ